MRNQRLPSRAFCIGLVALCATASIILFYSSLRLLARAAGKQIVKSITLPEIPLLPGRISAAEVEAVLGEILTTAVADPLPPVSEDAEIGLALGHYIRDTHIPIKCPEVETYMSRILAHLAKSSSIHRNDAHHFNFVIYDDRFIRKGSRAMSLPDGSLFIGIRIVMWVKTEADLAGVLAHETAHVTLRHAAQSRRYKQRGTVLEQRIAKALAAADADLHRLEEKNTLMRRSQALSYALILLADDIALAQQLEADRVGQELLRRAGYEDLVQIPAPEDTEQWQNGVITALRNLKMQEESKAHAKKGQRRERFIIGTETEFRAMRSCLKTCMAQIDALEKSETTTTEKERMRP